MFEQTSEYCTDTVLQYNISVAEIEIYPVHEKLNANSDMDINIRYNNINIDKR